MIRKAPSPVLGHLRVTFELPSCIWADRIFVTGDFNEWSHSATPMRQGRDGVWRAAVDLPTQHRFEFRYLIDGKWQTDYHADGSQTNEYGSENSIVDTGTEVESAREVGHGALLRESNVAALTPVPMAPALLPNRPVRQAAA